MKEKEFSRRPYNFKTGEDDMEQILYELVEKLVVNQKSVVCYWEA